MKKTYDNSLEMICRTQCPFDDCYPRRKECPYPKDARGRAKDVSSLKQNRAGVEVKKVEVVTCR